MNKGNVYLAGPMAGMEDFNFPAFERATKKLRAMGYTVFSPAESDLEEYGDLEGVKNNFDYRKCLKKDLVWILDNADHIALLPDWEKSKGVKAELALAEALNLTVIHLNERSDIKRVSAVWPNHAW